MKEATRRCLTCAYHLRDPGATPEQIITGNVPNLCLHAPPNTIPIAGPRGSMVLMTLYPMVDKNTLSCASFSPEAPEVKQPRERCKFCTTPDKCAERCMFEDVVSQAKSTRVDKGGQS
jgi:hypothetical protein